MCWFGPSYIAQEGVCLSDVLTDAGAQKAAQQIRVEVVFAADASLIVSDLRNTIIRPRQ